LREAKAGTVTRSFKATADKFGKIQGSPLPREVGRDSMALRAERSEKGTVTAAG
jgi:hypothetical protein